MPNLINPQSNLSISSSLSSQSTNLSVSKTHKTDLNQKQLKLLNTLYFFRFVTTETISEYIGVSRRSMHNSLLVLVDKGLLHRRYKPTDKLIHKPAAYCLAPAGIKALRNYYDNEGHELSDQRLQQFHNIYGDRTATEKFVAHSMNVMKVVMDIKLQTPKAFAMQTASLMTDRDEDEYPRPKPDIYLKRRKASQTKPNEYFVDIFEESVDLWIIKKRIRLYLLHLESYEWPEDVYPNALLIVKDNKKIARLEKYAAKRTEEQWSEGDIIFRILSSTENSKPLRLYL